MSGRSWCEVVSIAERQPDGQQTQRLRGRCDVMANRSDWGRGQPDECRGHHSPISRMGPRPCIPSRPAVMCAAQTGRTQDCTRPQSQSVKSILAMREPSTQDIRCAQRLPTILPCGGARSCAPGHGELDQNELLRPPSCGDVSPRYQRGQRRTGQTLLVPVPLRRRSLCQRQRRREAHRW